MACHGRTAQTLGSLLPSGTLLPFPGRSNLYGDALVDDNAWKQCLHLHEQVLQAVHEEQTLRKDWLDQVQHQYMGHADKFAEQMTAIVDRLVRKQEEWQQHFTEQLREHFMPDLFKPFKRRPNLPQQSSYAINEGSVNGANQSDFPVSVLDSQAQPETPKDQSGNEDTQTQNLPRQAGAQAQDGSRVENLNEESEHTFAEQMTAIVDMLVRKQEEWQQHVTEQLREHFMSDMFKPFKRRPNLPQQSSYAINEGSVNGANQSDVPVLVLDSQAQLETPKNQSGNEDTQIQNLPRQADAQAQDSSRVENLNEETEHARVRFACADMESLETHACLHVSSKHLDWHSQMFHDAMISYGPHGFLVSMGLVESKPLERPRSPLANLIHNFWFTSAFGILIIVNTLCIGIEVHVTVTHLLASPPLEVPDVFGIIDWFFVVVFTFELVLRLAGERWWFFFGPARGWNLLDFLLVLVSVFSKFLQGTTVLSVRAFRTLRSVRVLRLIRVLKFFRELRMMVLSIASALWSLFWAFALLLLFMLIFAITILQSVAHHLKDAEPDQALIEAFSIWYGGLPDTMYSLMQSISGGQDWGTVVEPLTQISGWWKVGFTLYIAFVVFGVLNVLTGVFVTTASEVMDRDLIVHSEEQKAQNFINDMKELYFEFDVDQNGVLTWKSFKEYMKNVKVQAYLSALGIECYDAFTLFSLLDIEEAQHVDIMEFILGCVKLRGQAKSIDLMILNKNMARHDVLLQQMQESLGSIHRKLGSLINAPTALANEI